MTFATEIYQHSVNMQVESIEKSNYCIKPGQNKRNNTVKGHRCTTALKNRATDDTVKVI